MFAWLGVALRQKSHHAVARIEEFIDYFECTWLNGQFWLTTWNVFMEDGRRTNNNLEGWHKITGKSHLNIFEMFELFKQASTEFGLRQLIAGGALRSVPPKQRTKERTNKKIRNLTMETTH